MRSKSLALLFILFTLVGTTSAWHAPDDDNDGAVVSWRHDHQAHDARFRGPRSPGPAHCAICHWLASFRTASAQHVSIPPALASVALAVVAPARRPRTTDILLQRSPRAPPLA